MLKKLWSNMMVADVNKAIDFYADVLGFQHVMSVPMGSEEVLFQYDGNKALVYALIKNGDIELMLQEQRSLRENVPAFADAADIRSSAVLYFEVDDLATLATRLKKHCEVVRDLHDTFYGMKEIYVKDLNGYVLGFAQPVAR
ncbi:glyoxalase [Verminephrobacter aporrectodeae subsp. tuberculatae]|uniref:VOC family protein n=1 Tax=Verminephrobacter aporrectodeae TaxID=1110389 RepID=UPI0002375756|nr:VOC family protein [Verminephrobacter aporrectodeae]MCW5256100.1 glyoxalase [Verminephrobacter aporrectodeae subsp. tuberculatae]MCW8164853.1 glyoxalase [Verminephrobacter aporrectodeae subsp. tuberculatae]MCW8169115.1 glyoxalase [Verminephrobacter aporrectodeae subsp. tuberculatae]MCW8206502.1 glyoxalase [Verminephrobacter aporrectodeae subsp. tuberculatae]